MNQESINPTLDNEESQNYLLNVLGFFMNENERDFRQVLGKVKDWIESIEQSDPQISEKIIYTLGIFANSDLTTASQILKRTRGLEPSFFAIPLDYTKNLEITEFTNKVFIAQRICLAVANNFSKEEN